MRLADQAGEQRAEAPELLPGVVLALASAALVFAPGAGAGAPHLDRCRQGAARQARHGAAGGVPRGLGPGVIPSLVKELQTLSRDAPHYAAQLRRNPTIRRFDNRYHISAKLVRDAEHLPEELAKLAGPLKDVTVGAAAFVTQLLAVLSIAFLLVLHGRRHAELGLALTGERQERYRHVLIDIKDSVAQYTLSKIVISAAATAATWIVLSILGVPYALALGLVVGFFDFIPLIGATLGAIVVALATLPVSFPTTTIIWIAFIIVWQRIEDYVIQPHVYGRTMNMNPLVTIVSLLVGAELLGILGVLLAIPAAAAIQIILLDWCSYRQGETTTAGGAVGADDTTAAGVDAATGPDNHGSVGRDRQVPPDA